MKRLLSNTTTSDLNKNFLVGCMRISGRYEGTFKACENFCEERSTSELLDGPTRREIDTSSCGCSGCFGFKCS
ncbi:hypothetical protein P8452_45680 [Trifolium repens]|nr:hypothetical protein P8452_45680 [Trifolium repens]